MVAWGVEPRARSRRKGALVVAKHVVIAGLVGAVACTASAQQVMMPDLTHNRIVLFSAVDGTLLNSNYFALAEGAPVHAMQVGHEIWVSEQTGDRVSRWSLTGAPLGALTGGMDNIRGMERIGGVVYVCNAGPENGAPGAAMVMFGPNGTPLGFFSTAGNSPSPFGVLDFRGGMLVSSAFADDDLHRYSAGGAPLGTFHNSGTINFAEQMCIASNGDVLVAGFLSDNVVRLNPDNGAVISSFFADGARGVFQLRNGNILWSNNTGVYVHNPATGQNRLQYSGGGRFLDLLDLNLECPADWNGDGQTDFFDYLDFVQDFDNDDADYNGDGQTDFFDYLDFVADFDAGCG